MPKQSRVVPGDGEAANPHIEDIGRAPTEKTPVPIENPAAVADGTPTKKYGIDEMHQRSSVDDLYEDDAKKQAEMAAYRAKWARYVLIHKQCTPPAPPSPICALSPRLKPPVALSHAGPQRFTRMRGTDPYEWTHSRNFNSSGTRPSKSRNPQRCESGT